MPLTTIMSVRPFPFDSGSPNPIKRQKTGSTDGVIDYAEFDSHSTWVDGEVATLPMIAPTQLLNSVVTSTGGPSQSTGIARFFSTAVQGSSSYTTQPTQLQTQLQTQPIYAPRIPSPTVQVPGSSPPALSALKSADKLIRDDGSVKPFSFYSSRNLKSTQSQSQSQGKTIDLTNDDGPQYIGSSSSETDHDIRPDFDKTLATRAKVPTMRELKMRRELEENSHVDRVEESPIGKNLNRFAYKPDTNAPNFGGRLDSIKGSGAGIAAAYSRPRQPQNQPERAQPVADIRLDDIWDTALRSKVVRIKSILPSKSNRAIILALNTKNGHFDDAIDYLTAEALVGSTGPKPVTQPVQGQTSRREARAPRKAIKEKWSSTQAQVHDSPSPPESPVKQPKRRLVKASATSSRAITPQATVDIDDDDDSEVDPEDDNPENETRLEAKVLKFINSCEVKDLIDIACTTEDSATAVLNMRPFKTIDNVRAVSTAAPPKKGKRGGLKRAIGDRLVDVCVETFRGYEAVDALIRKCEELGKPLAENIKRWGVDITGSNSNGELEIVNLDPQIDSGIGTPGEDENDGVVGERGRAKMGKFFPKQPKNMAPNMQLKDYQLVGINWLNMLYERKLSCILADEMGMWLLSATERASC